jgi:hypothetical protein
LNRNSRVIVTLISAFVLVALLTPMLSAQVLEKLPYSGGVLTARAIQAGRIHLPAVNSSNNAVNPDLACSPAPCLFPNVQASPGPQSADEHPLAGNPSNAMQLFTGANDLNCTSIVGQYASDDGGTTWKHACLKFGSGSTSGAGDPVGDYDLNNNLFGGGIQFDSTGKGHVWVSKSTDNGTTWGTPVKAVPAQLGYLTDKPWLETDKNPNSLFKNNIYISSTQFSPGGTNIQIFVSHSSDAGVTWTAKAVGAKQTFPNVDQFSDLAVGADGTVYVSWLRCLANGPQGDCGGTNATMLISKSIDGGNTWTPAVTIATAKLTPDPGFCCFYGGLPVTTSVRVSNIPVNAVSGSGATATVYASFYNWTGTQMQVEVAKSIDGGTTWGAPVRVSTSSTGDEFFQWINLASNGKKLAATWLDRRNDTANKLYRPFFASSNDGVTWSTNHAISTTKSDPTKGGGFGTFIGDYRANIWVGKAVYAVWPDTRTGAAQCEIGGVQLP